MTESTRQGPASIRAVMEELDGEYRNKFIAFCVAVAVTVILGSYGADSTFAQNWCIGLLFVIAVDLLSIRRCQRICKAVDLGKTETNIPDE